MWYVVQVFTGKEDAVRDLIEQAAEGCALDDGRPLLKECFVPRYQVERKYRGEWRRMERTLLPGYLIVVTSAVEKLEHRLARVPAFTKLLGSEESFIPLDRSEIAWINAFTSEKHRVITMSKGAVVGDEVVVTEGPLIGREGWITEVNRRKGIAYIEVPMFGRKMKAKVGLAIVSKK